MFKQIDFRALTAILLFLMALLEAIRFLTYYQPLVPLARRA